jgi:hypothetical protein
MHLDVPWFPVDLTHSTCNVVGQRILIVPILV